MVLHSTLLWLRLSPLPKLNPQDASMRLIIVLLLCVLLAPDHVAAQSNSTQLPASARVLLNRRFPGWTFGDITAEVLQFFNQSLQDASPVLISGDFDGDRRRDYAALIKQGKEFNYLGEPIRDRHLLVIFLRRTRGHRTYVIKDPTAGTYITLAKKGAGDYNYGTDKHVTYENDAIQLNYFEKAATSYVYRNGRFISFISGD